ncbi:Mitochondrial acidic protein mam33 [Bienertia sinuspersici]
MRNVRALQAIRKNREAIKAKGLNLLKVLQSEITHELSSPCFQNNPTGSPGDFKLEWDAPNSQDTVLQKKCSTGEEVAVSALLGPPGPPEYIGGTYPRVVNMKVCIKKPGLSSLLQFDCKVTNRSYSGPEFNICSANFLRSTSSIGRRYYTAPSFSEVNPQLQEAFREYLETKGIGESLMNFLLVHMHKKEENQYVNWLQKLQETVSTGE